MSVIVVVVVAVLAIVGVVAFLAMRRKPGVPVQDAPPVVQAPQQPANRPTAAPPQAGVAPVLERVSCETEGAVLGAMPPFGKLLFEQGILVFEATSRVVSASGSLSSGDGASTIQSVGSIERGQYRYEIPRAEVTGVEVAGSKVIVRTAATEYRFEGLGPTGAMLPGWLKGHGVG